MIHLNLFVQSLPKSTAFSRKTNNLIASLRGLPPNYSRAYLRKEKDLDAVMEKVIQQFSLEERRPEELIRAEWIQLVGERNATYAQPLSLHKNVRLYVAVSNPVIKQELQFHKKIILKGLKRIPGCSEIREIIFRAG
ncbi:MAG: hypothetical protein CMI18_00650 [Opitutaceae bacterium]|nr:hypothetical protein [Opitutaceae bacterium]|tara:strand:+ start:13709 stop:14119 length:411 start_codon:yes stop_codon:yes gene_type:complete